jgi:hypothetical protein
LKFEQQIVATPGEMPPSRCAVFFWWLGFLLFVTLIRPVTVHCQTIITSDSNSNNKPIVIVSGNGGNGGLNTNTVPTSLRNGKRRIRAVEELDLAFSDEPFEAVVASRMYSSQIAAGMTITVWRLRNMNVGDVSLWLTSLNPYFEALGIVRLFQQYHIDGFALRHLTVYQMEEWRIPHVHQLTIMRSRDKLLENEGYIACGVMCIITIIVAIIGVTMLILGFYCYYRMIRTLRRDPTDARAHALRRSQLAVLFFISGAIITLTISIIEQFYMSAISSIICFALFIKLKPGHPGVSSRLHHNLIPPHRRHATATAAATTSSIGDNANGNNGKTNGVRFSASTVSAPFIRRLRRMQVATTTPSPLPTLTPSDVTKNQMIATSSIGTMKPPQPVYDGELSSPLQRLSSPSPSPTSSSSPSSASLVSPNGVPLSISSSPLQTETGDGVTSPLSATSESPPSMYYTPHHQLHNNDYEMYTHALPLSAASVTRVTLENILPSSSSTTATTSLASPTDLINSITNNSEIMNVNNNNGEWSVPLSPKSPMIQRRGVLFPLPLAPPSSSITDTTPVIALPPSASMPTVPTAPTTTMSSNKGYTPLPSPSALPPVDPLFSGGTHMNMNGNHDPNAPLLSPSIALLTSPLRYAFPSAPSSPVHHDTTKVNNQ